MQHERSEVLRCRPGTITDSEFATVPDQRRSTSCRTASGTWAIGRRKFVALLGGAVTYRRPVYFCVWAGAVALGVVVTDIDTLP